MPYPAYWPTDDQFTDIVSVYADNPSVGGTEGVRLALNKADLDQFQVAPLDPASPMGAKIELEVSGTAAHKGGYTQDKYLPMRGIKGTPAGEGQTWKKNIRELLGQKRLSVRPGDWTAELVLVCKNQNRWTKYQDAVSAFAANGVDARTEFQAMNWASASGDAASFPVIDARRGEAWLWSGQPLDILHGVMSRGFQRIHCANTAGLGYGALGRGNYFTDKFSKALLYGINLRNLYFGKAEGADVRVLMLSRVLLGSYLSMDGMSSAEKKAQRFAHNVELSGTAQRTKRMAGAYGTPYQNYDQSVQAMVDAKTSRAPAQKGWKTAYEITGQNRPGNIGHESVHQHHKGSNEFCVAIGKQVYPEFLVFVKKV